MEKTLVIIEVSRNMCSVCAAALMYCLGLDEPVGSTGSGTMNRQAFRISPIGAVLPDFKDTVNVQTKESRPRLRFSSGMPKLQKVSDYSPSWSFAGCTLPSSRSTTWRCRRNPRNRQSHTRLPSTAYPAPSPNPYQRGSIKNALLASSS